MRALTKLLAVLLASSLAVSAQTDLTKEPTLYVVAYAHLDTQWRWEYPRVINDYIPKTMHDNFALFEKYPHYVFNFSGANRYRMMKEYWPADYARVKQYVAAGRWFPAGSSMEESDVNVPSADVYKGPSNVTPVVGHVSRGTAMPVLRNLGSWIKVSWPAAPDGID